MVDDVRVAVLGWQTIRLIHASLLSALPLLHAACDLKELKGRTAEFARNTI